ncbi:hypothetical protein C7271_09025 [filamentous cyanobacterium CCP5]|nr:hypothetical protein C7271_09025 [filamentous cyanobacterium CCP5]
MLSKLSTFGILGLITLGVSALPVKADTAVVQQSTQDLYIEGEGNAAVQDSQQINSIRTRVESRRGSTGIVQDQYQGATVVGEDNAAIQQSSQVNVIERRGVRNHGNRHNRGRINHN